MQWGGEMKLAFAGAPALCLFSCLICAAWAGCGGSGAPDDGVLPDILIPPVDSVAGDPSAADTVIPDVAETWVRDVPEYADISGLDLGAVECGEDGDCPQSGKPCEWVRCDIGTGSCVQSNSSKSGDMCDEGYRCRKDGRCEDGVCAYHSVECRDCGDGVCFSVGENCSDCPADCGNCPEMETDCQDGLDEDYDGLTDCLDKADCGRDPRCGVWKCVHDPIEEFMVCGQSLAVEPFGTAVHPDVEGCGVVPDEFSSVIYRFESTADQQVKVGLTPASASDQFRVFVLEGMCNPEYCIKAGNNNVDATFTAHRNWTYYLLIDTTTDFAEEVTVQVDCQP